MEHRPIRLFVTDMDGTLLGPDFAIGPENAAAIGRLEEEGILFAVATGRIRYDASTICERVRLKPYIISNNGACVFAPDGSLIHDRRIPADAVKELVEFLEQEEISYGLGESEHYVAPVYWEQVFEAEVARLRGQGRVIPDSKVDFARRETNEQNGIRFAKSREDCFRDHSPVYSISLVTYDQEKLEKVKEKLKVYDELMLSVSGTHNAEIMCRDGTKGHSLEVLCNYLHIDMEQVAAAGDSLNDLEMIKRAGLGIAVANARQEVLEASSLVTGKNTEHGIAQAIQVILQQKNN